MFPRLQFGEWGCSLDWIAKGGKRPHEARDLVGLETGELGNCGALDGLHFGKADGLQRRPPLGPLPHPALILTCRASARFGGICSPCLKSVAVPQVSIISSCGLYNDTCSDDTEGFMAPDWMSGSHIAPDTHRGPSRSCRGRSAVYHEAFGWQ